MITCQTSRYTSSALLLLLSLAACKEPAPPAPTRGRAVKPAPAARAAPSRKPAEAQIRVPAGRIPFEFPVVSTTARAGDFVLAVPSKWIREAFRRGESARPGDVVLTSWASGFGMQRAMVVRGKSRRRPRVRYLDMKYENPAGLARETDTLAPHTFHKLRGRWEPGTAVAIRDDEGFRHGIVVARHEQKLLTIGFGRKMEVVPRSDCVPLPIRPRLRRGDEVSVPYLGRFYPGVVKRVSIRIGRVFVTFQPEGKNRTLGVGFGNVIRLLRAPDVSPDAGPDAGPDLKPRSALPFPAK